MFPSTPPKPAQTIDFLHLSGLPLTMSGVSSAQWEVHGLPRGLMTITAHPHLADLYSVRMPGYAVIATYVRWQQLLSLHF